MTAERAYRYALHRDVAAQQSLVAPGRKGMAVWIMLNPSTADDTRDDPTIRKCIGFTSAWGYEQLAVYNLYSVRSTDPRALRRMTLEERVGPYGDASVREALDGLRELVTTFGERALVVCAWGAHALDDGRAAEVVAQVRARGFVPKCLGLTQDGKPRHPLMLAYSTPLTPFFGGGPVG